MSEKSLIAKSNRNWLKRKVRKGPVSKMHPWYSVPTKVQKERAAKTAKQLETGDDPESIERPEERLEE